MGFDLYFAGKVYDEVMQFAQQLNVCKLFTQDGERDAINEWADKKQAGTLKSKLFVDSGAYTAFTQGSEVDIDEYIAYINSITNNIDLFAEVDKIPGKKRGIPPTEEELLQAPEISWNNYLYMRSRVIHKNKLLPIFHQGEDFKWLKNMLEWRDEDGNPIEYIGISGSKQLSAKERLTWYYKVFEIIELSSNPKVKTHGFGTSSIKTLEMIPFTSSDATSWIRTAAFGSIMTDFGIITLSGVKQYEPDHINADELGKEVLEQYLASYGFELEKLVHDTETTKANIERFKFNLVYLQKWAESYQYKGPKTFVRKRLF